MTDFDLDARLASLPLLSRTALPPLPARELCDYARFLCRQGAPRRQHLARLPDFDLNQFDALPRVIAALEASEADLMESQRVHGPIVERLCDEAVALRTRFVQAARYFLRHSPEALHGIDALSHDRGVEALAIDLGHICELAARHENALKRACDLPANLAATARRLACALCLNEERPELRALRERRNAIYWLLCDALNELIAALRYLAPDEPVALADAPTADAPHGTTLFFERRVAGLPALDWAQHHHAARHLQELH